MSYAFIFVTQYFYLNIEKMLENLNMKKSLQTFWKFSIDSATGSWFPKFITRLTSKPEDYKVNRNTWEK